MSLDAKATEEMIVRTTHGVDANLVADGTGEVCEGLAFAVGQFDKAGWIHCGGGVEVSEVGERRGWLWLVARKRHEVEGRDGCRQVRQNEFIDLQCGGWRDGVGYWNKCRPATGGY